MALVRAFAAVMIMVSSAAHAQRALMMGAASAANPLTSITLSAGIAQQVFAAGQAQNGCALMNGTEQTLYVDTDGIATASSPRLGAHQVWSGPPGKPVSVMSPVGGTITVSRYGN